MKDPVILCPECHQRAVRLRKQSGFRCNNGNCARNQDLVATDLQVVVLKAHLIRESEEALLGWALAKCKEVNPPGRTERMELPL